MQLWLYLYFPALQLDALFSDQTQSPLVIVDGRAHHVVQANPNALDQGIKIGMGLGSAAAMCHSLQVHPYDEKVEEQTLTDIAQWLYLVTSDIVLMPPQGILLKVTDMLSLYGGLMKYWDILSQHLNTLQLRYHFACGFSPYSAILLAKGQQDFLSEDKQQLLERIQPFPLAATELTIKQVETLSRVGIQTLADLLALPLQEVARRFDIDLVNYLGRLMGQFKHPVTYYHPPEHFQSYLALLFDIENIQWLEKPLTILLNKLEHFLNLRNQVAYELSLQLHQRDGQSNQITFTSACGDYQASRWMTLCQLTLERVQLEAPVQGLTLKIERSGELEANAQDLFCGHQGQQSELELIALLQAKLGKEQVRKIARTDDPRPEKATVLCAPTHAPSQIRRVTRLRPSLMLPEPESLTEKVTLIQGPERLVTGWWDGDSVIRDYFVARSQQGRWLWVFRDQDKHWFLHGQFS
ncbi:DNA polymerase Y family protein [Vibrio sp. NTOU-M3]|uniref:Y-family DNA polymerase n=1 Tax=Vibrio sp. NTOU-M3 TaxID=3234954 RepID=UPI00349F7693